MLPLRKRRPLLLLALSILPLPGCETPTTAPTSAAAIAGSIGHIRPSRRDTCETQQQVAAQSSKIATIETGKEVVYKADCAWAPTVKPAKGSPRVS